MRGMRPLAGDRHCMNARRALYNTGIARAAVQQVSTVSSGPGTGE